MKAKIKQQEAFMAINKETKGGLGIIALSHTYNRITFFGISHTKYHKLAGMLMSYALHRYLIYTVYNELRNNR